MDTSILDRDSDDDSINDSFVENLPDGVAWKEATGGVEAWTTNDADALFDALYAGPVAE